MRQYITSDLHFFHTRIIKYADRIGYNETDDDCLKMNQDIAKFIDDNIPDEKDVEIWNLGDVFYGPLLHKQNQDAFTEIMWKMRGKHRTLKLVLGNHDKQFRLYWWYIDPSPMTPSCWTDESLFRYLGFANVYEHPVILHNKFILSHEPVYLSKNSNLINIHGHTHQMFVSEDYFTWKYDNHEMIEKAYHDSDRDLPENFYDRIENYEGRFVNPCNYINACWDATKNHHIMEIT